MGSDQEDQEDPEDSVANVSSAWMTWCDRCCATIHSTKSRVAYTEADNSVPTYDPTLDYGWVTNQPCLLTNNDNFDPCDLDAWPSDVGLRATRAHPTYLIHGATLKRSDGTTISTTETVETSNLFTRFKDDLVIWSLFIG